MAAPWGRGPRCAVGRGDPAERWGRQGWGSSRGGLRRGAGPGPAQGCPQLLLADAVASGCTTHWCVLGRRHPGSGRRADARQPEQGLRTGAWPWPPWPPRLRCHSSPLLLMASGHRLGGGHSSLDAVWELPFGLWRLNVGQHGVVRGRPRPLLLSPSLLGCWGAGRGKMEKGGKRKKTATSPPLKFLWAAVPDCRRSWRS